MFSVFCRLATSAESEDALIIKVQEYCYENLVFQKVFQKIILLFYNAEVLSRDTILKWYRGGHSNKVSPLASLLSCFFLDWWIIVYDPKLILFALTPQGKTLFLKQMKKFVERLENAEEEEEGEGVEEENAEEEGGGKKE